MAVNKQIRSILTGTLNILLPTGLFCLILSIKIPESLARLHNQFQIGHFLFLTLLFFIFFQYGGKAGWAAGCGLAMALFAFQLASKWSLGISNANIIGGFLPYKDGFYYYNGARMLLAGHAITGEGLQGAFRPLFPGMLAVQLLLAQNNFLYVIAANVFLVALCCYFAARSVQNTFGSLPAAVLMVLQYAFIRPMIGFSLTELPSLLFSCLAFILLLKGAESKKFFDISFGCLLLIIAISVRAGAFFILPLLILWVGWIFRTGKKMSFKKMALFGAVFSAEFLAVNIIFPKLVTATDSSTFGNFSWMLYGQAVGGAGWTYHLQALGTHDSSVVMQAAIDKILTYPLGLVIGTVKSYRDFFLPGITSMFYLILFDHDIVNYLFWLVNICLLVLGFIHALRRIHDPKYSLLIACFLGTIFSIPFLPPIDGGNRFYSGIVPFFFAIEAIGLFAILSKFKIKNVPIEKSIEAGLEWIKGLAWVLTACILIAPIGVISFKRLPAITPPTCPKDQIPYAVQLDEGTFIDIVPSENTQCGNFPVLCLDEFEKNGVDKHTDDFFRKLVELASDRKNGIRVSASVDLISLKYSFFVFPMESNLDSGKRLLYTGCAQKIKTQFQNILLVNSFTQ